MRKGSVLPLVLGLTSILAALGMSLFWVSRHQLLGVHHYLNREQGYHLARGALELGLAQMDQVLDFLNDSDPATFPKREKAPPSLTRLIASILDSQGRLVSEANLNLEFDFAHALGLNAGEAEVRVDFHFQKKGVLHAESISGVVPDPREAAYLLSVVAEAQVSKVQTRLTAFKECKQISILPPVLGKFTLFLLRPGILQANAIQDAKAPVDAYQIPLIVRSGATLTPGTPLSLSQTRDFLENQGWIYLGGVPWSLSLSHGWGVSQAQDAFANRPLEYYPVGTGTRAGKDQKLLDLSLDPNIGEFEWWRSGSGLFQEYSELSEFEVLSLLGADEVKKTSLLNLFGSRENPSPTLILGDVRRKWALIQGLHNQSHGITASLPFLTPDIFALNSGWPGNPQPGTIQIFKEVFDSDFSEYTAQMSRVVEEGYNQVHLANVSFGDPGLDNQFHLECDQLNPDLQNQSRLEKISTELGEPRFCERILGSSYTLKDDGGRLLFTDSAFESISNLSFLSQKSGRVFSRGEDFLQSFQPAGQSEGSLSGIALVKGDLRIHRDLKIRKDGGGIVLVEGNIILEKRIQSPGSDPLTLVSLAGNIQVKVQDKIEAGLVALQGRVSFGPKFHLRGILAAKELSIDPSPIPILPGNRTLSYNPRFDPTSSANATSALKIMTQERWRFTVR